MPAAARLTDIGSAHACFPDSAITQGSPDVIINGLAAARKGDTVATHTCTCPNCVHGTHPRSIAAGSSTVIINGKPAARMGDAVSCGGNIATGSGNVIIGDTPWRSPTHDCGVQSLKNPLLILSPPLEALKDPVSWSR